MTESTGEIFTDTVSFSSRIRKNYDASVQYPSGRTDSRHITVTAALTFIILIAVNLFRMSYDNFWGDEVYSIDVAHMTYSEIIDYAAKIDSHPPLYNLYLSLLCQIFGYQPLVYHLSAILPYIGMMIIGMTFVRNNFGSLSAIFFMSLATMMSSSFYYINESRMYELGAFLILLSFVASYHVIRNGSIGWYAVLITSSLAAAYTHYYCFLACVILLASMFIFFLIGNRSELKRFIPAGMIAVIGYLPWGIISLTYTFSRDSRDFWIKDTMSTLDCTGSLFNGILAWPLVIVFLIAIAIMMKRNYQSPSKEYHRTEYAWTIIGVACIFYSIMIGVLISIITRPMIIARYLYPVSVIAWLLLSVSVSRLNCFKINRMKLSAIIVALFLIISAPIFCISMCQEYEDNQSTQNIVSCVNDRTEGDDTILTNNWQLYNNVCGYYFPGLNTTEIDSNLPTLDHNEHYVIILDDTSDISSYEEQLTRQGFIPERIASGSFAKEYNVTAYDLTPGYPIHLA